MARGDPWDAHAFTCTQAHDRRAGRCSGCKPALPYPSLARPKTPAASLLGCSFASALSESLAQRYRSRCVQAPRAARPHKCHQPPVPSRRCFGAAVEAPQLVTGRRRPPGALRHSTMSGPHGTSLSEQMAALQKRVDRREKRRGLDRQQRAVRWPACHGPSRRPPVFRSHRGPPAALLPARLLASTTWLGGKQCQLGGVAFWPGPSLQRVARSRCS